MSESQALAAWSRWWNLLVESGQEHRLERSEVPCIWHRLTEVKTWIPDFKMHGRDCGSDTASAPNSTVDDALNLEAVSHWPKDAAAPAPNSTVDDADPSTQSLAKKRKFQTETSLPQPNDEPIAM